MRNLKINEKTPLWQEGYISRKMDILPERIIITKNVKCHMRHKPYQNDFSDEIIKK